MLVQSHFYTLICCRVTTRRGGGCILLLEDCTHKYWNIDIYTNTHLLNIPLEKWQSIVHFYNKISCRKCTELGDNIH